MCSDLFGQLRVRCKGMAVARNEFGTPVDYSQGAESVVLQLEDKVRIIEWQTTASGAALAGVP